MTLTSIFAIGYLDFYPRSLLGFNKHTFSFLWLYSQILGLGRLHGTFCFISVTRSRTVGRGEQLVARTLLTAPGDCDDYGDVGGTNGLGWGNRSTQRKPAPTPLCPPQIPLAKPGREPGPPRWEASD
jgi:hypothetical protein